MPKQRDQAFFVEHRARLQFNGATGHMEIKQSPPAGMDDARPYYEALKGEENGMALRAFAGNGAYIVRKLDVDGPDNGKTVGMNEDVGSRYTRYEIHTDPRASGPGM